MQKKVFLSCSSRDHEIALTICRALEARGHPCWMSSRDVMPGENFQGAIVRAIRSAGVMVMVFSANANNSDEIKKEIALAGQTRLMVIPVRVEDVTPSEDFSYELATRQWVDLFHNWEFAIEQLGRQIDYVIPKEAPEVAPPVAAPQPPPVPPQMRVPESAPPKQTPDAVAPRPPARTGLMAGKRKPLAVAAGLLLLIGAGVAAFVFQKSNMANLTPVAQAAAEQRALAASVQRAFVAANATLDRALAAQAKAQAVVQQAEAAARRAEAGAAGYGVRTGRNSDGDGMWQWKGQVAANNPSGVGVFTIISGDSKGTRYAGEMHDHARNGSGVGTAVLSSSQLYLYEGEWQDDRQQGAGVLTASPREESGQWDKGNFASGVLKDSSGTGTTADGTRWTGPIVWWGNFKGYGPDGYAAMYDLYGHLLEGGLYENGKLKTALTAASRAVFSSIPAAAPQKAAGNNAVPAKATSAAKVVVTQKQPVLNPLKQQAADAARAAEKRARAAQAKARAAAQQAEAAARQAEAGTAGYGTLTARIGDSDWRWEGQVANNRAEGLGVSSYTSGSFKDTRYAGEMHNGFEQGVGVETSPVARYEGEWQDGYENGAGVMTLTKFEDEQAGQWVKGDMISGYENGEPKTAR